LDKHRGAHLCLGVVVTVSPGTLGARLGPHVGVMPVWDGLMGGTTTFSSARANLVVAWRAQSLAVSGNVLKPSASQALQRQAARGDVVRVRQAV
jgi:fluoride ion exporter CrcB/FEX